MVVQHRPSESRGFWDVAGQGPRHYALTGTRSISRRKEAAVAGTQSREKAVTISATRVMRSFMERP